MALAAIRLVFHGEGRLAVMTGAAQLPLAHGRHGEWSGLPFLHLEDLGVADGAFLRLFLVLLVAEGDRSRTVLALLKGEVRGRLDLRSREAQGKGGEMHRLPQGLP